MNDQQKWEDMQCAIALIKENRMNNAEIKPSSERIEQTRGLLEKIFEQGPSTWCREGEEAGRFGQESPHASQCSNSQSPLSPHSPSFLTQTSPTNRHLPPEAKEVFQISPGRKEATGVFIQRNLNIAEHYIEYAE